MYWRGSNGGFRVHPTSFKAAVDVALNDEFNFKAARIGTHGYRPHSANSFSSLLEENIVDYYRDAVSLGDEDHDPAMSASHKPSRIAPNTFSERSISQAVPA